MAQGQTLLENYTSSDTSGLGADFHGFIRGIIYTGMTPEPRKMEAKSLYGEAALQMQASFRSWGKGVAELRFRKGSAFGSDLDMLQLREGFVEIYAGRFEFAFGQQIIVWGKADGINPTNQITPQDALIRSPDPDDSRMGNILFRTRYQMANAASLEALWIPHYEPSILPWQFAALPEGTMFSEGPYPDAKLENSALAVKFGWQLPSFDGSLSYNNGYGLNPGITADVPGPLEPPPAFTEVYTKAYRQQIIGMDFSTTFGATGLRGEAAYRITKKDQRDRLEVPNPDLHYVVGLDRFFGPVHIIAQYIGRYVFDFTELIPPTDSLDMMRYALENGNRLFHMQQVEWSHSASLRVAMDLMHETMTAEVFGMGNFSTDEYVVIPKFSYRISDGLRFSLGLEYYSGVQNTLFDIIEDHFNSVFMEFKAMF
jgi:hypothetical protein